MNSMVAQVQSLPELIRESTPKLDDAIRTTLDHEICLSLKRVFITGCGDSHHAALNTELAFESLAGLPTEPMTALQFSHYGVGYLPDTGPGTNAVIGISVSGEVARTTEALNLARKAGAETLSVTATPGSRVDLAGGRTIFSTTTPFPDPPGVHTPGIRTYTANQLVLLLMAVRLGEVRGNLTSEVAKGLRKEILALADAVEETTQNCERTAREIAETWSDAGEFVFAGSGPNFGTALFSAAKVLEASGDPAIGQDLEEWAHLQFFVKAPSTPTFIINASDRDLSRAGEVVTAARKIGRRVVIIAPPGRSDLTAEAEFYLPIAEGVREAFSPVISAIPGELFSAYRAEVLDEPYFRNFGGGRSTEGGGGISRIRDSEMLEEILK